MDNEYGQICLASVLLCTTLPGYYALMNPYITYGCGMQYATQAAWSCYGDRESQEKEKEEEKGDKHCREKSSVMACLKSKLAMCSNKNDILSEMDASYDQCDGTELKPWIKHYFRTRYMPLTEECRSLVSRRLFGDCNKSEKKYDTSSSGSWSFIGGKAEQEGLIIDGIECMSPLLVRSSIEECGGQNGFDVYTRALAPYINMPLFGMGLYHRFSMAASLAEKLTFDNEYHSYNY